MSALLDVIRTLQDLEARMEPIENRVNMISMELEKEPGIVRRPTAAEIRAEQLKEEFAQFTSDMKIRDCIDEIL